MKKLLLAAMFILTTLLLSSCVGLTNISTPRTVALNQANFRFVKSVSAETKAIYVFLIGGFKDRATADVVEKLREEAQLQSNQALADIRVKVTTKCYCGGLGIKRTLTATATVVEFCDIKTKAFKGDENLEQIQNQSSKQESIKVESEKSKVNKSVKGVKIKESTEQNISSESNTGSTREYVYHQLLDIKKILESGNDINVEDIKHKVKRIEKWYNDIKSTYPEIKTLLKEIKKLLKD